MPTPYAASSRTAVATIAQASATPSPTQTPAPSATPSPSPSRTATASPTPSSTPDVYAGYTIEGLRARSYGGGEITVHETMAVTEGFTRMLVSYPSDGLTIYGFLNLPHGEGPFPVAIVLHGYIEPSEYQTLAYSTRYADALAGAGYVVFHPNLRSYPPSDNGPNGFRVGMAVDVLNLLALIREHAGKPGPLEAADGQAVGIMGHSMGGGITWRVIAVDRGVGAAVLYASMHADEAMNIRQMVQWSGGRSYQPESSTPPEDLARISPASFLQDIVAPVSIHHSVHDTTVPVAWSEDMAGRMEALGLPVELYLYEHTPHTFRGDADALFMQRMIAFFDEHLR